MPLPVHVGAVGLMFKSLANLPRPHWPYIYISSSGSCIISFVRAAITLVSRSVGQSVIASRSPGNNVIVFFFPLHLICRQRIQKCTEGTKKRRKRIQIDEGNATKQKWSKIWFKLDGLLGLRLAGLTWNLLLHFFADTPHDFQQRHPCIISQVWR